jgi:hypothetical protein
MENINARNSEESSYSLLSYCITDFKSCRSCTINIVTTFLEDEVEVMLQLTVRWAVNPGVGHSSGAHDQILFFYCLIVVGFLMWGALSDDKMSL